MDAAMQELRERLAEVSDLEQAASTLQWDQQTMMPRAGAPARAEQLATLETVLHERATSSLIGTLLDRAAAEVAGEPSESDAASLVRVARRDYEKARRVPGELKAEMARSASLGQEAWERARAQSDFALFRPHLERGLELKRRYVECFAGEFDCAYDALLDDFEPGTRTAEVAAVFEQLKAGLVPLIAAIAERVGTLSEEEEAASSPLHGAFPADQQRALMLGILPRLGFDPAGWRLDEAAHPFATGTPGDVRLTTRYEEDHLGMALYSGLHECGHGLYEAGVAPELARTPLGSGVSLGLHESQSRLWENVVGRSRPFCAWVLPQLRAAFPSQFAGVEVEELFRAANRVRPSLIRVEADEATYSLHVILRFELEQELIEGRLAVADLPEAWNARMRDYLGVEVPDDARGVLQDVHWSAGLFGYFPTYALGNIISLQIWERARAELPDLDVRIERGELAPLREWLREHLHRYGRKFTPGETLVLAAGAPLDVGPYLGYLREKLGVVYGLAG